MHVYYTNLEDIIIYSLYENTGLQTIIQKFHLASPN